MKGIEVRRLHVWRWPSSLLIYLGLLDHFGIGSQQVAQTRFVLHRGSIRSKVVLKKHEIAEYICEISLCAVGYRSFRSTCVDFVLVAQEFEWRRRGKVNDQTTLN